MLNKIRNSFPCNNSQVDIINFTELFEELDQEAWDKQFENHVTSGKLDALANQAIADFKAGKCKEISDNYETMLASEAVLGRDWDRPEEDEAWKDL